MSFQNQFFAKKLMETLGYALLSGTIVSISVAVNTVVTEKFGGVFGSLFATLPIPNLVYSIVFALSLSEEKYALAISSGGFGYFCITLTFSSVRIMIEKIGPTARTPGSNSSRQKKRIGLVYFLAQVVWFGLAIAISTIRQTTNFIDSSIQSLQLYSLAFYLLAFIPSLYFACIVPKPNVTAKKLPTKVVIFIRSGFGFCIAFAIIVISRLQPTFGGFLATYPTVGLLSLFSVWFYSSIQPSPFCHVADDVALGMVHPLLVMNFATTSFWMANSLCFNIFQLSWEVSVAVSFLFSSSFLVTLFLLLRWRASKLQQPSDQPIHKPLAQDEFEESLEQAELDDRLVEMEDSDARRTE